MARTKTSNSNEKSFPSIVNEGYFSDYFLAYRLDSGLRDLYRRWDELEKAGEPTPRTRVRSLSNVFDKYRAEASEAVPDGEDSDTDRGGWSLERLTPEAVESLRDLNDGVLRALGWEPGRDQPLNLRSGDKRVEVPLAHLCRTATGPLLVALDTVFAKDPSIVVADKNAPGGTLLDPVLVNHKPEGNTLLEACQLIFTADDPPTYVLACSGGSITLLDRERWGEGVYLAVDLEEAIARNDAKAKGELAAIAALFGADTINPGEDAESVLNSLLEQSANESAGVSKELRYGVRRSVELLANAVVRDIRERQRTGWTDLDPDELTKQCLRYLYRIIVLLFAEARPELGILPVDEPDYQEGYSLTRLRDLALTELHSDQARHSTHIQESLALLFRMVNDGYQPEGTLEHDARGLSFPGLDSQLFSESACELLDRSRLIDETLQQVLVNLCFSQEKSGKSRQSLSYATLGINQLGAVYEGLMAYKGFLATEELFELDDDGDPDTGTWVIAVDRADEFPDDVFLKEEGPDGEERRVRYQKGDFVFRLSGRDRQRSASYYTPEVLTEFTVRHALDVYWEEHPNLTAADILDITVCEPALGSGAFLNEAVNQLAARYLKAAQDETGETIDADQYQRELQKAKAHFAINQCYGVDLNPTAVELAEVSLWLNCMHQDLKAPRFGARLRRGNSLIGARRATYTIEQVENQPWKRSKKSPLLPPIDQPMSEVPFGAVSGIHHFLLPGEGWGAPADAVELKGKKGLEGLAEDWSASVREWKKQVQKKPSKGQLERLRSLAARVEAAWARAAEDATEHAKGHNRSIELWQSPPDMREPGTATSTRYSDPEGPAARLRMLMDAWCALWMWAPENGTDLPTFDEWLDAAELLLGQPSLEDRGTLFSAHDVDEGTLDSVYLFGRASISELVERFKWLGGCRAIARQQGFFHWGLEFPHIFQVGGFDLPVGNPPWVRLDWNEPQCLAEHDPWWGVTDLTKASDPEKRDRKARTLEIPDARSGYRRDRAENEGIATLLGASSREPTLTGLRTNLYMVFITNTWRRADHSGVVGLLHPESHFVDPKAGQLRSAAYQRLRRHWQFANELFLFKDVHHVTEFGVNIYADSRAPRFLQAVNLLAPGTLDRSLDHDGTGETPGIQYPEGGWDLRPHRQRIVVVDESVLADWVRLFDSPDTPVSWSRLVRPLTVADLGALSIFANQPARLGNRQRHWTTGFNETNQREEGTIVLSPTRPETLQSVILQGPHVLNATPFAQEPRADYRNNTDWDPIDLEKTVSDFIPRTIYQPAVESDEFLQKVENAHGAVTVREYREVHREFVNPGHERTLKVAIIPPDVAHLYTLVSMRLVDNRATVKWAGYLSSLPVDYLFKVAGTTHVSAGATDSVPVPEGSEVLDNALILRTLRLNCLTESYSELWQDLYDKSWAKDHLGSASPVWSYDVALRSDFERWLALCEIDAIVALLLGLTEHQLIQLYRSQFAVLRKYEHQMVFDARGRQICRYHQAYGVKQAEWEAAVNQRAVSSYEKRLRIWDRVQAHMAGDTTTDLGPFETPFRPADREAAMRQAYRAFAEQRESDA